MITRISKSVVALLLLPFLCLVINGCTPQSQAPETAALPYPLDTCIVTDEKLDADSDMKPYTFVHEGQEIKLCCKSCVKDFNKDPDTYLKKLKKAPKTTPAE